MTIVVDFDGTEKLDNLVGARTSIYDEIHENRKQLYRH